MRSCKVKRSSCNRTNLAGGYHHRINRSECRGFQGKYMIKNIPVPRSLQIEICMIGQIYKCFLVCGTFVIHHYFIIIGPGIDNFSCCCAGETHFHIGTYISKLNCREFAVLNHLCVPYNTVPSAGSSVKRIWSVVYRKSIFNSVKGEFCIRNSVSISAYQ